MKGLGLINKKERWGLTLKGWLLTSSLLMVLVYVFINSLYGFLAVHDPVDAKILVIESWLPDFALESLLNEIDIETYDVIISAGGTELKGSYLSPYETTADELAATLAVIGVDSQKIRVIQNPSVKKDRTYTSALMVKEWLLFSDLQATAIDIVTIGPHARRSRLLFEMAMNKEVKVGVINIQDINYNPDAWWRSSAGLRTMSVEFIGYLYAKFLFYP